MQASPRAIVHSTQSSLIILQSINFLFHLFRINKNDLFTFSFHFSISIYLLSISKLFFNSNFTYLVSMVPTNVKKLRSISISWINFFLFIQLMKIFDFFLRQSKTCEYLMLWYPIFFILLNFVLENEKFYQVNHVNVRRVREKNCGKCRER